MAEDNVLPWLGERPPVLCGHCYVSGLCSGGRQPRRDTHAEWIEVNGTAADSVGRLTEGGTVSGEKRMKIRHVEFKGGAVYDHAMSRELIARLRTATAEQMAYRNYGLAKLMTDAAIWISIMTDAFMEEGDDGGG